MAKKTQCVCCGKQYHESNGYGYCLSCEEGIDGRDYPKPVPKSRRSQLKQARRT